MANRTPETMSTSYKHEDQDGMGLAKDHKLQRELDQQNRDSAINRAMAEVAGWKRHEKHTDPLIPEHLVAWTDGDRVLFREKLPNYLTDLNAVHEVEKLLYAKHWFSYETNLEIVAPHRAIRATARQRCTAILKTLNRWNPEWDYPI
jgi:hypothetical protein